MAKMIKADGSVIEAVWIVYRDDAPRSEVAEAGDVPSLKEPENNAISYWRKALWLLFGSYLVLLVAWIGMIMMLADIYK